MESVWPVSKLSTESVGSRRELVANCVHHADATQLDSFVASASAVCIYWALYCVELLLSTDFRNDVVVVVAVVIIGTESLRRPGSHEHGHV